VVCDETVEVERIACTNADCQGDVIYDGMCLTCLSSQDNPQEFRSGLADEELGREHLYEFVYWRDTHSLIDMRHLLDDEMAKEHARLAMLAPHLTGWNMVTIRHEGGGNRMAPFDLGSRSRLLGTWVRLADGLTWEVGTEPDVLGRRQT